MFVQIILLKNFDGEDIMSRSRNYVFTWNNYDEGAYLHLEELVASLGARYICVGEEVGAGGTPHLQGFITFVNARTPRGVRNVLPGSHIEIARGTAEQAISYCKKDGVFREFGDPPATQEARGQGERHRWKRTMELAQEGNIEEIDPDIYVRFGLNLFISS